MHAPRRGRTLTTVLPEILLSAEEKVHSMVLCTAATAAFNQDVFDSVNTAEHFALVFDHDLLHTQFIESSLLSNTCKD